MRMIGSDRQVRHVRFWVKLAVMFHICFLLLLLCCRLRCRANKLSDLCGALALSCEYIMSIARSVPRKFFCHFVVCRRLRCPANRSLPKVPVPINALLPLRRSCDAVPYPSICVRRQNVRGIVGDVLALSHFRRSLASLPSPWRPIEAYRSPLTDTEMTTKLSHIIKHIRHWMWPLA